MFNDDSFVEYSFKGKIHRDFYLKLLFAFLIFVFGNIIFTMFDGWGILIGPTVAIVGICLYFYVWGFRKIEYEYTLTNGNIEIAAIYKLSKRREFMHFEMEQVEMIAPADSKRLENIKYDKKSSFVSRKQEAERIALLVDVNKHRELVIMEPNERCLEHIKLYAKKKYYDD